MEMGTKKGTRENKSPRNSKNWKFAKVVPREKKDEYSMPINLEF